MKIRNGFVSNSSSASFIVRINDDKLYPHYPDIESLLTGLYELIDIDSFKERCSWWVQKENDQYNYHYESAKRALEIIEQLEKQKWYDRDRTLKSELVMLYCKINWVRIREEDEFVKISSECTVYNEISDVNDVLRDIVFILVHNGIEFTYEVVCD